jgi:hypothetical protein
MALNGFLGKKRTAAGGTSSPALKRLRGQAAITDAIYFLVIATALSAFLFSFSLSYGQSLEQNVQRKEIQEFTASALKTIIYTSIPRDPAQRITAAVIADPSTTETDFLLAGIKEDYFDDQALGDSAPLLRNNVHLAMLPLEPANDYLFYFYIPLDAGGLYANQSTSNKFPFFLFYKSEYDIVPSGGSSSNPLDFVEIIPKGHTYYYCRPDSPDAVDNLLFTLTAKSKTTGRSRLLFTNASGLQFRNLETALIVWPSQSFPDRGADNVFDALHCVDASKWDPDCYRDPAKAALKQGVDCAAFTATKIFCPSGNPICS